MKRKKKKQPVPNVLKVYKVFKKPPFTLEELLKFGSTQHFSDDRQKRRNVALNRLLDKDDYLVCIMSVDHGHPDGLELHCITHSGLIFILSEFKYNLKLPCVITILNAREKQLTRYGSENFQPDEYTLQKGREHEAHHDNEI